MLEAIILDSNSISRTLGFYNLVIVFILKSVYVGNGTISHATDPVKWHLFVRGNVQKLSFKVEDDSKLFATLPEWLFEDICNYYLFVVRYAYMGNP